MTSFSELKKGLFESRWTRFAFITILAQCFLVVVFESVTYVSHKSEIVLIQQFDPSNSNNANESMVALGLNETTSDLQLAYSQALKNALSLSLYHILFMVAQVFTVLVQIDAILAKNTMQLIAVTFFEFCMMVYSVVQYHQADVLLDEHKTPYIATIKQELVDRREFHNSAWSEIVVIITMFIFSFVQGGLAWRLFQEFGWSIYKKIGADLAMRDMFRWYQVFIMILKFDVFFFLGFSVQYLVILQTNGFKQNLITHIVLSLLVSMVMLILAFWGVISERTTVMIMFMVCGIGSLAYFIYIITDVNKYIAPGLPQPYLGSQVFLTFFLSVCIVLIVITLIVSYLCLRNFGKGLKFHVKHENQELSNAVLMDGVNSSGQYVHRETKDRRWSIE